MKIYIDNTGKIVKTVDLSVAQGNTLDTLFVYSEEYMDELKVNFSSITVPIHGEYKGKEGNLYKYAVKITAAVTNVSIPSQYTIVTGTIRGYKRVDGNLIAFSSGSFKLQVIKSEDDYESDLYSFADVNDIWISIGRTKQELYTINEYINRVDTDLQNFKSTVVLKTDYNSDKDLIYSAINLKSDKTYVDNEINTVKGLINEKAYTSTVEVLDNKVDSVIDGTTNISVYGKGLTATYDSNSGDLIVKLINEGKTISEQRVTLPFQDVIVSGFYDDQVKALVLQLKSGTVVSIPVSDIVDGLVSENTMRNYVDESLASRTYTKNEIDDNIDSLVTEKIGNKLVSYDSSIHILEEFKNDVIVGETAFELVRVNSDTVKLISGSSYDIDREIYADGDIIIDANADVEVKWIYPEPVEAKTYHYASAESVDSVNVRVTNIETQLEGIEGLLNTLVD